MRTGCIRYLKDSCKESITWVVQDNETGDMSAVVFPRDCNHRVGDRVSFLSIEEKASANAE